MVADEIPPPPSGEDLDAVVGILARAAASGADFGGWLAVALARTAARLGSSEALLAGRPGSWEAAAVRQILAGTVGEDDEYLDAYRDQGETGEGHAS